MEDNTKREEEQEEPMPTFSNKYEETGSLSQSMNSEMDSSNEDVESQKLDSIEEEVPASQEEEEAPVSQEEESPVSQEEESPASPEEEQESPASPEEESPASQEEESPVSPEEEEQESPVSPEEEEEAPASEEKPVQESRQTEKVDNVLRQAGNFRKKLNTLKKRLPYMDDSEKDEIRNGVIHEFINVLKISKPTSTRKRFGRRLNGLRNSFHESLNLLNGTSKKRPKRKSRKQKVESIPPPMEASS